MDVPAPIVRPPPGLARFVEDVRTLSPLPGAAVELEWLPDGRTTLLFRALEGEAGGELWIGGPRTRALFKRKTGVVRTLSLRFKPGWSVPVLGIPAGQLTDRMVPAEDVWGGVARRLGEEVFASRHPAEVLDRVGRALGARTREGGDTASGRLARRAVEILEQGEVRVEQVAARLGVSSRHLRRAFADHVGVPPKEFARAVRLQRALRLSARGRDWARIAKDAGYYDQAHLIADFGQLVGMTPGAYARRMAARAG